MSALLKRHVRNYPQTLDLAKFVEHFHFPSLAFPLFDLYSILLQLLLSINTLLEIIPCSEKDSCDDFFSIAKRGGKEWVKKEIRGGKIEMLTNLLCIASCVKKIHPNIPRNANIDTQFLLFCDFIPSRQAEYQRSPNRCYTLSACKSCLIKYE